MTDSKSALVKVADALAFAAHKHRGQHRIDAARSPYINHPIDLLNVLCCEAGIENPDILCAAILHDTLEDTNTSEEEITRRFGPKVAAIVGEVSDDMRLPKRKRWQLQIEKAPHLSREAKIVKLADKICNLRDLANSPPPHWSRDRIQTYFDWAKAVIEQLRGTHPKLETLFDDAYAKRP